MENMKADDSLRLKQVLVYWIGWMVIEQMRQKILYACLPYCPCFAAAPEMLSIVSRGVKTALLCTYLEIESLDQTF